MVLSPRRMSLAACPFHRLFSLSRPQLQRLHYLLAQQVVPGLHGFRVWVPIAVNEGTTMHPSPGTLHACSSFAKGAAEQRQ
jgi:hypothetical protein